MYTVLILKSRPVAENQHFDGKKPICKGFSLGLEGRIKIKRPHSGTVLIKSLAAEVDKVADRTISWGSNGPLIHKFIFCFRPKSAIFVLIFSFECA